MKTIQNLKNDKKGVFGLTAVQQFFAIILTIAILAYVIVVVMGTLSNANITGMQWRASVTVVNETVTNVTSVASQNRTLASYTGGHPQETCTVLTCSNSTSGDWINSTSNPYTVNNCQIGPTTTANYNQSDWLCTYTYTYRENTVYGDRANSVLLNTSTGISGFFRSISPVFAILAILVIILVLVVLVRVVQVPQGGTPAATPL